MGVEALWDVCVVGGHGDLVLANELAGGGARTVLLDVTSEHPVPNTGGLETVALRPLYAPTHAHAPLLSLLTHHWLAQRRFRHVVFAAPFSTGYYALVARDLGLDHQGTGLWCAGGKCLALDLFEKAAFPEGRTHMELDFLERETLRRADGMILRSHDEAKLLSDLGLPVPPDVVLRGEGQWTLRDMPARTRPLADPVSISVCMPTYNRADMLAEAVRSLMAQTMTDFEVVLVDDGSSDPGALALINSLEPEFRRRGWTILRQDNAGPAAARCAARRVAKGSHLLFMDDDNVALANEIERFALAARSGADVLTCIPGQHPGTQLGPGPVAMVQVPDPAHPRVGIDWTPVGACAALAVMVNCLGDNNALIRADVYDQLGGHADDPDFVLEDFHLLTRAVAREFRLEVVPEPLFLYRRHEESRSMGDRIYSSHMRSLEPWLDLVPPGLRPLLINARRDWYDRHRRACAEGRE